MWRFKTIAGRESHVRVRGANAPWTDPTARPPMPPRLYELRHLLTDEALCDPANQLPFPVTTTANHTITRNCTTCQAELEAWRSGLRGWGCVEGEGGLNSTERGAGIEGCPGPGEGGGGGVRGVGSTADHMGLRETVYVPGVSILRRVS